MGLLTQQITSSAA